MPLYQTILWFTFFICSLVGIGVLLISPPKVAKHYDCNKIYPKFQQDIGQYMVENGFNPNSKIAQTQINLAGGMANAVTPAAAQEFKQAQNQWTEAYLRFKTGAGTNAHEIEANRQTYFPVFGDSPAQINQKARMRQQAENDIAIATGRVNPIQGAISTQPIAPQQSAQPVASTQQTPSLWGKATVVGQ